jgi:hypothetical protein
MQLPSDYDGSSNVSTWIPLKIALVYRIIHSAQKAVNLPLSKPIRGLDGTEMHSILVPKNTDVIVSILASNRNRDIWGPDSHEWKPERWLQHLPESVTSAHIPGIYSNL